jgi:hypothetical protein
MRRRKGRSSLRSRSRRCRHVELDPARDEEDRDLEAESDGVHLVMEQPARLSAIPEPRSSIHGLNWQVAYSDSVSILCF